MNTHEAAVAFGRRSPGGASAATMCVAFGLALFGVKLWIIASFGNATPFWDQWDSEAAFLYTPFLDGNLAWQQLIAPHNEHRILMTRLLALGLLGINGVWNPLLQMVVNAALHIAALGLAALLFARVAGREYLPALLVFSFALFAVPYAWENTLAGFQSQFYFLLLLSFAALWFAASAPAFGRRWWIAVALGAMSYFSMASGALTFATLAAVAAVRFAAGPRRNRAELAGTLALAGLFLVAYQFTPVVEHHASLRASSWGQFQGAAVAALAWPLPASFLGGVLRNAPALAFAVLLLRRAGKAPAADWYLLGVVAWAMGQSLGVAYGRTGDVHASRYLDLLAIGVLANFACLLRLVAVHRAEHPAAALGSAILWLAMILLSVGAGLAGPLARDMAGKRAQGLAQEANTRNFLQTGDIAHLKGKPHLHVPYPDPQRLASVLQSASLRSILPSNISPPLAARAIDVEPAGAFVPGGFFPATPARPEPTLGSYAAGGDASLGKARLHFELKTVAGFISIPVAGYPLDSGMGIRLEQGGLSRQLRATANPREGWAYVDVKVAKGPFDLVLDDGSPSTWVAVGGPRVMGRLDGVAAWLLSNFHVPIIAAAVLCLFLLVHGAVLMAHGGRSSPR